MMSFNVSPSSSVMSITALLILWFLIALNIPVQAIVPHVSRRSNCRIILVPRFLLLIVPQLMVRLVLPAFQITY